MVDQIKEAIAEAYHTAYPNYQIRDEDVPAGLTKPTFIIKVYDFQYQQSLGDRYTGTLFFDDLYFPSSQAVGLNSECLAVQQAITRAFMNLTGFRALRQSCEVIDNVLHHKYRIKYKELRQEDVDTINTMLLNSVTEKEAD